MLLGQGAVDQHECVKLSGTKFIAADRWQALKRYEQEFLRCYAVGAAARTGVLVSRSAARLNGLWVVPKRDESVELANRRGHPPSKSKWPAGTVYRHIALPDRDIRTVESFDPAGAGSVISLTSPVRTAVDIARIHGVRHGVVAMDSLLEGRPLTNQREVRGMLAATVARLAGKRGIDRARKALALCSGLSESPYESLFRMILFENRIKVQEQMWLGPDFRVDFLWGQLIIEIDGRGKFEDTPHGTVLKQLERENRLKEQGFEFIRHFPREILGDEQGCVHRTIDAKARADARGPALITPSRHRPF